MTDEPILPGEVYVTFDGDEEAGGMILRNPRWV